MQLQLGVSITNLAKEWIEELWKRVVVYEGKQLRLEIQCHLPHNPKPTPSIRKYRTTVLN